MVDWKPKAEALVKELVQSGELRAPAWQNAFASVPRHLFVPSYWEFSSERNFVDQTDPKRWLAGVYSNQVLITQTKPQLDDEDTLIPTSSSSMPAVMAHMLEILDVRDGQRVLEIGTGTGYNIALLACRLGDAHVASVDLDPELVKTAGERLAQAGYMPTIRVGDGTAGLPDAAPFDRIIATAAIDHVPPAWIEQLAPGGLIVAPLQGSISGGLVKLIKTSEDKVEGRFDAYPVAFMPMRPTIDNPLRHEPAEVIIDRNNPYRSTTTIDPRFVSENDNFRFFLQLHFGATVTESLNVDDAGELFVTATDGSWFVVNNRHDWEFSVSQGGPRRLWDGVEAVYVLSGRLCHPTREHFGVTATDDLQNQRVWLNGPAGDYVWPLPL